MQFIRSCTAYIEQEPILDAENVQEALLLPEDILNRGNSRISGSEKTADCTVARGLLLGKKLYLLDEGISTTSSNRWPYDIPCATTAIPSSSSSTTWM